MANGAPGEDQHGTRDNKGEAKSPTAERGGEDGGGEEERRREGEEEEKDESVRANE